MRFTWDNTPEDVLPPTHNVATTPENPVTGLRPGETYREFFARMDASINHSFANGTPEQIQRWTARRIKHSALELPTREGNPLVFFWEDEEVRKLIGRKHWRNTFEDSGKSQRRYNPVLDQWDVCPFLDPGYRPDDSNEEYYDEHWPSQGHVFEIERSTGVDTGSRAAPIWAKNVCFPNDWKLCFPKFFRVNRHLSRQAERSRRRDFSFSHLVPLFFSSQIDS